MAQPRSKRELPAQLGQSDAYLNYKRHIVQGLAVSNLKCNTAG